jgi:AcrR family transcriptional regulator
MVDGSVKRRTYHSPKRAEQARRTRERIRATAERLFVRDGYLPTSMKSIAAGANVAERTLYLAFPTKAALLNEIIRVAVRGHDHDEPLAAGAAWNEVLEAPAGELIARLAEFTTALMSRTARVLAIGTAAATVDPDLAHHRDRGHAATRCEMRALAHALKDRCELAEDATVEHAADALFAIAADEALYLRLIDTCGWNDTEYADLLERLLTAALT